MIASGDILAGIFFAGVLPLLGLAFCYWRMACNVLGRTSADARRRARHISVYAVVVGFVAGLYVLGGIAGVLAVLNSGGLEVDVIAGSSAGLFGVLVALTLIPAFTVVGQLRRLDRDDQEQLELEIDRSTGWIERCGWTALLLATLVCSVMLGFALVFALVILLLAVPTVAWYRQRNREAQLLWLLALAVRQKRDLAAELDRHARTWCGTHACRLRELAMQIKGGRSLATALMAGRPPERTVEQVFWLLFLLSILPILVFLLGFFSSSSMIQGMETGLALASIVLAIEFLLYAAVWFGQFRGMLPAWCMTAIRVGEESGSLDTALAECATEHLTWLRDRFRAGSPSGLVYYLAIVLLFLGSITTFLCYTIVPKYKYIFNGFGVEMPKLSVAVYSLADLLAGPLLFVLPALPLLMLMIIAMDDIGWRNLRFRPFASFYRRFDASGILRHLARTIESRKPLTEGLLAMANSHHRPVIATDLAAILSHVESGSDCWTQLLRRGFIGPRDLAVIESAERTGNLAWALREVATTRERRLQYRIDALLILLRPIVIVLMGVLVGAIVLSMFLPLVKLLNDLA
ncbi:hypothetical protein GC176_02695 [bacterium]|nr:hypothetical protein [bacterium]